MLSRKRHRAELDEAQVEVTGELLRTVPRALLASQLLALLIYAVLFEHSDFAQLTTWILVFSAISLARFAFATHQRRHYARHPRRSANLYALGAFLGGTSWAVVMLFHSPELPLNVQLMLFTALVCLPPSSLPSNAIHSGTFIAFSTPIFVALALWGLFAEGAHGITFTVMAILYAALMLITGLNYAHVLRENMRSNAENRRLLAHLQESNQRLMRFAYQDPLTELSNRRRFDEHAEELTEEARRKGLELALVLIDIDDFKQVNDTLGHEAGDELLRLIAQRIDNASRHSELLMLERYEAARIGGDEFVVLYQAPPEHMNAQAIAQRILDAVARPLELSGQHFQPKISIGVAWTDGQAIDIQTLLRRADNAMYRAKQSGGNRIEHYTPDPELHVIDGRREA